MKKGITKYFIFLIGGGLGLLVNLVITFFLTEFLHLWHMVSYIFGLAANIVVNFVYHKYITFKVKDKMQKRILKFIVVYFLVVIVSWALVYLFTEIIVFSSFKYYYLIIIVLVTLVVSIVNYLLNKLWVFNEEIKKAEI